MGLSHFIAFCIIVLHRCCAFLQWKERSSASKKIVIYGVLLMAEGGSGGQKGYL